MAFFLLGAHRAAEAQVGGNVPHGQRQSNSIPPWSKAQRGPSAVARRPRSENVQSPGLRGNIAALLAGDAQFARRAGLLGVSDRLFIILLLTPT